MSLSHWIICTFIVCENDTDRDTNKAQGDASLSGIRYAVVNRSGKAVVVDGVTRAAGEVVVILTTDGSGKCLTSGKKLPYGTYQVYELRKDASIAVGDVYNGSSTATDTCSRHRMKLSQSGRTVK